MYLARELYMQPKRKTNLCDVHLFLGTGLRLAIAMTDLSYFPIPSNGGVWPFCVRGGTTYPCSPMHVRRLMSALS